METYYPVIAICALMNFLLARLACRLFPQSVLRPFVFVMLIVIAIYTLVKKLRQVHTEQKITTKMLSRFSWYWQFGDWFYGRYFWAR